jgi:hypothetical protein
VHRTYVTVRKCSGGSRARQGCLVLNRTCCWATGSTATPKNCFQVQQVVYSSSTPHTQTQTRSSTSQANSPQLAEKAVAQSVVVSEAPQQPCLTGTMAYLSKFHCQAAVLLAVMCCTSLTFQYASAHGYMSQPLSRPLKANLMQADWARWGNEYTPQQVIFLGRHHLSPNAVCCPSPKRIQQLGIYTCGLCHNTTMHTTACRENTLLRFTSCSLLRVHPSLQCRVVSSQQLADQVDVVSPSSLSACVALHATAVALSAAVADVWLGWVSFLQIWNGGWNPSTAAGLIWPARPSGQLCGYGSVGTNVTRWRQPGATTATYASGSVVSVVSCMTALHKGRCAVASVYQ